MKPAQTAIILVDDDNDFLSEGGVLHGAVKAVLESNRVVDNINDLLDRARRRGVRIVHVPIAFSPEYSEMGDRPYGIFAAVKQAGAFQKGSWGAGVADVIDAQDGDIVVEGKSSTCAFETTDLQAVLDGHGITTLVLGGLLTNICIESTMRSAYDKGYEVYTLMDCSATLDAAAQKTAIEYDWPMFSRPVTHDKFLDELE